MTIIWHNGEFKEDGPVFWPSDRIRLGDGVFDTMLAIDGTPVFSNEHFERLLDHAASININVAYKINALIKNCEELLERNNAQRGHAVINTILSHGPGQRGVVTPENPNPQIVMRMCPPPQKLGSIRAIIAESTRRNEGSPLSQIKSFNYGDNILAMDEAQSAGVEDAILLNNKGQITCSTIGNIFICERDELITPPLEDGCMDGILRSKILQHYHAIERSILPGNLLRSDGIYVVNSVRGAIPVLRINEQAIPAPKIQIDPEFHMR